MILSNLENKLSAPKCEVCNISSAYICTSHNPHANLCSNHLGRHIGGDHILLNLFDTNDEIPDLDDLIKLQAKKILDNKQMIITFICNTMIGIEKLARILDEKFDELFKKIIIMRNIGKPRDFDLLEINQFDIVAEIIFLQSGSLKT